MEDHARRPSLRKRIQGGLISSIEELKAAFKAEAKLTHPDLAGADAAEDFVRLRRDYDAALRALALEARPASRSSPGAAESDGDSGNREGGDPFAALELLLKRGFPKAPRHDKERLRYAYARMRARARLRALDEEAPVLFDRFEAELFALKETDGRDFRATVGLFADLVAARKDGSAALLAARRMELGRRSSPLVLGAASPSASDKPLGSAAAAFLGLLART